MEPGLGDKNIIGNTGTCMNDVQVLLHRIGQSYIFVRERTNDCGAQAGPHLYRKEVFKKTSRSLCVVKHRKTYTILYCIVRDINGYKGERKQ